MNNLVAIHALSSLETSAKRTACCIDGDHYGFSQLKGSSLIGGYSLDDLVVMTPRAIAPND